MSERGKKSSGTKWLIAVVAVLAVGAAVLAVMLGPGGVGGLFGQVTPAERADQVLAGIKAESPYVAVLEQNRPDVYDALRESLMQDAEAELPVMQMANHGRQVLTAWLQEAIATAPDAVALEMLAMTTEQLRELRSSNPALCAAMVTGQPLDDVDSFVSEQMRERERAAYQALAASDPDVAVVTLPQAEVEAAYGAIAPELEVRFGADLALLNQPAEDDETAGRLCEIQIAVLEAFGEMAPDRAAALARALLGGAEPD